MILIANSGEFHKFSSQGGKYLLSMDQPHAGLQAILDLHAVMKSATSIITTRTLLYVW